MMPFFLEETDTSNNCSDMYAKPQAIALSRTVKYYLLIYDRIIF